MTIDFPKVIEIVRTAPDNHLAQSEAICKYLVKNHFVTPVPEEDIEPVAIAVICVFSVTQKDFMIGREACQHATYVENAERILYRAMELNTGESFQISLAGTLGPAIKEVVAGSVKEFKYMQGFHEGLASGVLFWNTKEMLTSKIDEVREDAKRYHVLQGTIDKMRSSFQEFMRTELPEEFLQYAIDAQIIQPYIVSTRVSQEQILSQIIDKRMPEKCKQLGGDPPSGDPGYRNLILQTRQKTVGGSHTRIGLVPIGMSFDEFKRRFQRVFDDTVQEYLQENHRPPEDASKFSANLARFFASPLAFKLVKAGKDSDEITPDHPIHVIKDLIISRLGFTENIELVTTSKSEQEKTITVKQVLLNLFDAKASVFALIRPEISQIMTRYPKLEPFISRKDDFDEKLKRSLGCTTFTNLAETIYKLRTKLGRDKAIITISGNLGGVFAFEKLKPAEEDITQIAIAIESSLGNIGEVMRY